MAAPPAIRRALLFALGASLCLGSLLVARMLLGARAELVAAQAPCAARDLPTCARLLRRSMAYYLPGNPWVRRAAETLRGVALEAEARGPSTEALRAWHELRSAVVALRSVGQPYPELLAESAEHLAALQSRHPEAAPRLRTAAGRAAHAARLAHPPEPRRLFTALGLLGFVLFTGGGLLLCFKGLAPDATLVRNRFWPWLGAVLLGLLLLGIGLRLA